MGRSARRGPAPGAAAAAAAGGVAAGGGGSGGTGPPTDPAAYYSIRIGLAAQQEGKNRYSGGIVPFDFNRVEGASYPPTAPATGSTNANANVNVNSNPDRPRPLAENEYLNASWIREMHGQKWWVAAQAPVPETMHAFLSLCCAPVAPPASALAPGTVKPRRVEVIVVLTRDVELRVRKADPYIPTSVGGSVTHAPPPEHPGGEPITVQLLSQESLPGQIVLSRLSVNGHAVRHYLYEGWPDHGVPLSPGPLLALVERVDELLMDSASGAGGQGGLGIVHCSAGIGRTGTWLALCSLLRWYGLLRPVKPAPAARELSPDAAADHPAPQQQQHVSFAPAPSRGHSPSHIHNLPLPPPPPFGPSPLGPLPPLAVSAKDKPLRDEVALEVDGLRDQRTGMVQRDEQVLFLYQTMREALMRVERERQRERSQSRDRAAGPALTVSSAAGGAGAGGAGSVERGREAERGRGAERGRSLSRLREGEGRSESRDGRRGRGYADMRGSEED
ncbi:phosphatases II [Calocera viscosa TUFC12733]|uniref:Phosphatases II n=1 Tax=Calocera viscosa (strain TUFC12733) TaxID=1330018 RepID=A0A167JW99_CALVF|nr:phosphatases II [Calocera viscosa TUFC12733]